MEHLELFDEYVLGGDNVYFLSHSFSDTSLYNAKNNNTVCVRAYPDELSVLQLSCHLSLLFLIPALLSSPLLSSPLLSTPLLSSLASHLFLSLLSSLLLAS